MIEILFALLVFGMAIIIGWIVWRRSHARPCVICKGTMYRIPFSGGTVSRVSHVIQTYAWKCETCHRRCRIDGFDKLVAE